MGRKKLNLTEAKIEKMLLNGRGKGKGNTKTEKQAVIVSLCEGAKEDIISISYPDLYLYLQDYNLKMKGLRNILQLIRSVRLKTELTTVF